MSELTFTMSGVMGLPTLFACSIYLLRSTSKNSNTRYSFASACTMSRSL